MTWQEQCLVLVVLIAPFSPISRILDDLNVLIVGQWHKVGSGIVPWTFGLKGAMGIRANVIGNDCFCLPPALFRVVWGRLSSRPPVDIRRFAGPPSIPDLPRRPRTPIVVRAVDGEVFGWRMPCLHFIIPCTHAVSYFVASRAN